MKHPHLIYMQLLQRRHRMQPITRRVYGALSSFSWFQILRPSPHIGALASMSQIFHLLFQQSLHFIDQKFMNPLQKWVLICLPQLHFNLILIEIGELAVCKNLPGEISSMPSKGNPSAKKSVDDMYWGGQLNSDCPLGVVTLILSIVFLMKYTPDMTVQYSSSAMTVFYAGCLMIMEEESSGCNVEDNDDSLRSESVPHPVLPHLNRVFRFDYLAELLSECSFRLFFLSSLSSTGQSMGYFLLSLRSVSLGGWALYLSLLFLLVLWFAGSYYEDANTFQQIHPMQMFKKYYKEAGKQALASGQACSLPT